MKNKFRVVLFALSLTLVQLACSLAQPAQPTETPTPRPSATPLPTRAPSATPTEMVDVLFYDDFSQLDSAWVIPRSNTITGDLHLSGYRVSISAPYTVEWLPAGNRVEDMRVEVDVRRLVGGDTSEVGLLCRYLSDSDFYAASINGAGDYTIYKLRARNWVPLATGMVIMPESGLSNAHLTLDCIGEVIAFFMNDQLLAIAYDSEFRLGKGGLFIYSAEEEENEFWFDEFYVRIPPEDSPASSSPVARISSEVISDDLALAGFDEAQGRLAWEFTNTFNVQLDGEHYRKTWQELANGRRYRDFILVYDVTWETTTGLAGCGAILRAGNSIHEDAYIRLDTWRFSGLPSWVLEYIKFNRHQGYISGNIRSDIAIRQGNASTNHYVIVVKGTSYTVYVNGERLGTGTGPEAMTQGKLALYAWQESGRTTCSFTNIWVWEIIKD